jgi:5,10-methylenetetrahydrofolate reductase
VTSLFHECFHDETKRNSWHSSTRAAPQVQVFVQHLHSLPLPARARVSAQVQVFVICNYFYDNRYFFDFLERCRGMGIDLPILPGVMPIYSVKMMDMLANLCGATVTGDIRDGIAALPEGDTGALLEFGIDFAVRQCRELLQAGVPGLHIYTMDRSPSAAGIVERLRSDGLL